MRTQGFVIAKRLRSKNPSLSAKALKNQRFFYSYQLCQRCQSLVIDNAKSITRDQFYDG